MGTTFDISISSGMGIRMPFAEKKGQAAPSNAGFSNFLDAMQN